MEAKRACVIAGVSYKVADYWAREAGIAPTTVARGKGSRRAYNFADVVGLRLAVRMRDASIPLAVIATAVAHVRQRRGLGGPNARLPGVWLAVSSDSERVFEVREGESMPRPRTNAGSTLHLAPLGAVVAEVAALFGAGETVAVAPSRPARPARPARPMPAGRRYR